MPSNDERQRSISALLVDDDGPVKTFIEIAAHFKGTGKPLPPGIGMFAAEEYLRDMRNKEFPPGTEFFDVEGIAVARLREGFCVAVELRGPRPFPSGLGKVFSPVSAKEFYATIAALK